MYQRTVKVETVYDGQRVSMVLKQLTIEDIMTIRAAESESAALVVYASMLPRYVVHAELPHVADGQPLTVEEMCGAFYFMPLLGEVFAKHIDAATVSNPTQPVGQH